MKKIFMCLTLILATIFCFYGIVLADGGGPEDPDASDCACLAAGEDVEPTSGPYIWGTFTVGRDLDTFGVPYDFLTPNDPGDHFNVHVTLRRWGKVHLFNTFRRVPDEILNGDYNICDLTNADLMEAYRSLACDLEVEEAFGLTGTPVIVKLKIRQRECSVDNEGEDTDPEQQMIRGTILLRVVPEVSCTP